MGRALSGRTLTKLQLVQLAVALQEDSKTGKERENEPDVKTSECFFFFDLCSDRLGRAVGLSFEQQVGSLITNDSDDHQQTTWSCIKADRSDLKL